MRVVLVSCLVAVCLQKISLANHVGERTKSSISTEYKAQFHQVPEHGGNGSHSTIEGNHHLEREGCEEEWEGFAAKCANLIKDLVSALASAVTSRPGDKTNLKLDIRNHIFHHDNRKFNTSKPIGFARVRISENCGNGGNASSGSVVSQSLTSMHDSVSGASNAGETYSSGCGEASGVEEQQLPQQQQTRATYAKEIPVGAARSQISTVQPGGEDQFAGDDCVPSLPPAVEEDTSNAHRESEYPTPAPTMNTPATFEVLYLPTTPAGNIQDARISDYPNGGERPQVEDSSRNESLNNGAASEISAAPDDEPFFAQVPEQQAFFGSGINPEIAYEDPEEDALKESPLYFSQPTGDPSSAAAAAAAALVTHRDNIDNPKSVEYSDFPSPSDFDSRTDVPQVMANDPQPPPEIFSQHLIPDSRNIPSADAQVSPATGNPDPEDALQDESLGPGEKAECTEPPLLAEQQSAFLPDQPPSGGLLLSDDADFPPDVAPLKGDFVIIESPLAHPDADLPPETPEMLIPGEKTDPTYPEPQEVAYNSEDGVARAHESLPRDFAEFTAPGYAAGSHFPQNSSPEQDPTSEASEDCTTTSATQPPAFQNMENVPAAQSESDLKQPALEVIPTEDLGSSEVVQLPDIVIPGRDSMKEDPGPEPSAAWSQQQPFPDPQPWSTVPSSWPEAAASNAANPVPVPEVPEASSSEGAISTETPEIIADGYAYRALPSGDVLLQENGNSPPPDDTFSTVPAQNPERFQNPEIIVSTSLPNHQQQQALNQDEPSAFTIIVPDDSVPAKPFPSSSSLTVDNQLPPSADQQPNDHDPLEYHDVILPERQRPHGQIPITDLREPEYRDPSASSDQETVFVLPKEDASTASDYFRPAPDSLSRGELGVDGGPPFRDVNSPPDQTASPAEIAKIHDNLQQSQQATSAPDAQVPRSTASVFPATFPEVSTPSTLVIPIRPISVSRKLPDPTDDSSSRERDSSESCSCDDCYYEDIKDHESFCKNACKDLEQARDELKAIFDKIKKKLRCLNEKKALADSP